VDLLNLLRKSAFARETFCKENFSAETDRCTDSTRRANHPCFTPSLPATNAKRLRKGALATKQSTSPREGKKEWIASLRSQ
jgi:hypothetical protein